ncbi:MAG: outer membrane beta-barrel protein [Flavobacteriaceae bacterium]
MNKKDIDKLFQDKLGDYREIPDEKVWQSIEQSLDQRKKSRRIIPIWWKLGGAAAVLAITLMVWNPFSSKAPVDATITDVESSVPENRSQIKDQPKKPGQESEIPAAEITVTGEEQGPKTENKNNPVDSVNKDIQVVSEGNPNTELPANTTTEVLGKTDEVLVENSTTEKIIDPVGEGDRSEKEVAQIRQDLLQNEIDVEDSSGLAERAAEQGVADNEIADSPAQMEIAEQLAEKEADEKSGKKSIFDEINKEEEEALAEVSGPKWSVGPSIAPVYFNSFGDGSPIHSNFASNSKTGNVNLSYGVGVSYDVTKKLSLRSGLHKVDFGYNTNDIIFSSSLVASTSSEITNINYNSNSRNLVVESSASRTSTAEFSANDIVAQSPSRSGSMVQEFGYLEVPLELNYAILDRRLGINLVGGFSSLFLVNNSVTLESSGSTTEMGEANNLNDLNFSTNLGMGINYKLNDKMKVHLEPMFKYHMNMFSGVEGSFQPFSLGVYTGMSFKF